MTTPNIVPVASVLRSADEVKVLLPGGRWVPARGLGYPSLRYRLRAAWLVLTGRADALVWEGQP